MAPRLDHFIYNYKVRDFATNRFLGAKTFQDLQETGPLVSKTSKTS